jgi:Transposase IS116/IS110/IS902 family
MPCQDIELLWRRQRTLEGDIESGLRQHQVEAVTTIEGIGPQTAACIMAETGDPSRSHSLAALASDVGLSSCANSNRGLDDKESRRRPRVPRPCPKPAAGALLTALAAVYDGSRT